MSRRKHMIILDPSLRKVERVGNKPTGIEKRRRFLLFAAIVLASLIALLVIVDGAISLYATIAQTNQPGEISITKEFSSEDALDILFIKVNDTRTKLINAVLVRFDPVNGCVVCTALESSVSTGERTLEQSFVLGGSAQCAADLAALLGMKPPETSTMTYAAVRDLVTEFGGVTLEVPCDIDYRDPTGARNIVVAAGKRKFQGGEAARLLDCPDWPGGTVQQTQLHAQVLSGLINERLLPDKLSRLDRYYSRAHSCMDSSTVSMSVFQSATDSLTHLAALNTKGEIAWIYQPEYETLPDGLALSSQSLQKLRMLYAG